MSAIPPGELSFCVSIKKVTSLKQMYLSNDNCYKLEFCYRVVAICRDKKKPTKKKITHINKTDKELEQYITCPVYAKYSESP